MQNIKTIILLLTISFLFISCSEKQPEDITTQKLYELKQNSNIPSFNSEYAYKHIEKQVSFGPRNPGSVGHQNALNYFKKELNKYADKLELQTFNYTGYDSEKLELTNVIAKFNPENKNRIIISAHWDTRPRAEHAEDSTKQNQPIIGANDGASGCGVILELARLLKFNKVNYGIDLILFDGEDYGKKNDLDNFCLGSKYFSGTIKNLDQNAFAINLDMIGDKNAKFPQEGYSVHFAPDVVKMIWGIAEKQNVQQFKFNRAQSIYDDHVPLNQAGIKAIDIVDLELIGADTPDKNRNYWHSHKDTLDKINQNTIQQVGEVLTELIYTLNFNTEEKPV